METHHRSVMLRILAPTALIVFGIALAVIITSANKSSDSGGISTNAAEKQRDLGASTLRVLTAVTMPMIAPALIAAFCLCFTLSWDEFIIAFLVTRFDVTLPVVIWTLLRGGLNPQTNAVGSFIFMCSILMLIAVELLLFRKRAE